MAMRDMPTGPERRGIAANWCRMLILARRPAGYATAARKPGSAMPTVGHVRHIRRMKYRIMALFVVTAGTVLSVAPGFVTATGGDTARRPNPISLTVTAGLSGEYRDGTWLPLFADVTNTGADVNAQLQVVDNQAGGTVGPPLPFGVVYETQAILPGGAHKRLTVMVPT